MHFLVQKALGNIFALILLFEMPAQSFKLTVEHLWSPLVPHDVHREAGGMRAVVACFWIPLSVRASYGISALLVLGALLGPGSLSWGGAVAIWGSVWVDAGLCLG